MIKQVTGGIHMFSELQEQIDNKKCSRISYSKITLIAMPLICILGLEPIGGNLLLATSKQ